MRLSRAPIRFRVSAESGAITMHFPTDFFYYTSCGVAATSINIVSLDFWRMPFYWNGKKFISDTSCIPAPPPPPGPNFQHNPRPHASFQKF